MRRFAPAAASFALLVACSSSPPAESGTDEAALVSDASSMVQRPDGSWDVVCKSGTREVVTTAQILANQVCATPAPGPVRCVPFCKARYADGSCQTFGPDYCDHDATCVPQVTARYTDGSPKTYAPDFCRAGAAACVEQCVARYADGSCQTYGRDICGETGARCVARCNARYADGSCRTYGPDFCRPSGPAPTCIVNCVERYADGTCKTYGADLCR